MKSNFNEIYEKVLNRERRQKVFINNFDNFKVLKIVVVAINNNNNNNRSNSKSRKDNEQSKYNEYNYLYFEDSYQTIYFKKILQKQRDNYKNRIIKYQKKKVEARKVNKTNKNNKDDKENKDKKKKVYYIINISTKDLDFFFNTIVSFYYIYFKI